jgi:hypothetical protein
MSTFRQPTPPSYLAGTPMRSSNSSLVRVLRRRVPVRLEAFSGRLRFRDSRSLRACSARRASSSTAASFCETLSCESLPVVLCVGLLVFDVKVFHDKRIYSPAEPSWCRSFVAKAFESQSPLCGLLFVKSLRLACWVHTETLVGQG